MTTIILVLLALAIWFYGPAFRYMDYAPFAPVINRIIAIGVLIILWGINNYFLARRAGRKKPKVSKESAIIIRDEVDDLIALITQSFRNFLKTVRSKWTGEEKGLRSLYALPWYLLIGPADSGKSTLIRDGDLTFPLAHLLNDTHEKNAGAQELPQYWVSNEGILFDIPGRWLDKQAPISFKEPENFYPTQASEEEAEEDSPSPTPALHQQKAARTRIWDAFLHLLSEARPRRPINGVIVNFDLVELARMNERQRSQAANRIHTHLIDIAEKLGTRFTVHVVMTKLDRFAGFTDYFAQIPKGDRKLPFGFSFPVYNEMESDKWIEDFERAFEQFLSQANDDMLDKLYVQRDLDGRRNIYIFLRQLASIAPVVREFCRRALLADKFSTPPLVRGVYFTSPKQEGVPFNGLLHRIALEYRMDPPISRAHGSGSSRFFCDHLFRDVIFKEAGLAGDNKQVENRKRFVLNASIVTSVLFVLGFGFLLNEAMRDNRARAENVLAAGNDFINLPRDHAAENMNNDESRYIAALNAIEAANNEFPGWKEKSDARRYLALYQGRRVGPEVEKTYEDLLRRRFVPAIAEEIKAEIIRLGQDPATRDSDERLDALRVYLLLGQIDIRQQLDARDMNRHSLGQAAVLSWLANNWQQRFEGKSQLQGDLRRHLNYVLVSNRIAAPIDANLVAKTRADLLNIPRDVRLYRTLKSLASRQMPGGISFRSTLGPSFDMIFKQQSDESSRGTDIVIPHFYTKRGFHEFFITRNDDLSIIALEDAWVTGESEHVHYSEEDLENFRQKIRQAYATDYINSWQDALQSLDIVDFKSIEHASLVLAEINGPANPFGRLITLVKTETEVYSPAPVELEEAQSQTELHFDRNREHGQRITRNFIPLRHMLEAQDGQVEPFEQVLTSIGALETYMRGILSGRQSSRPLALERARERANLSGNDPIFIVRRTGASLPLPFDKFFTQIADHSWRTILDAAKIDLQTVWQEDVYRRFNIDLADKYPFNAQAGEEVTLAEFQKFFGPQGDFDTFFNENLRIFVNPNTSQPMLIDGQSLNISAEFVRQLATVRTVRDVFFNADGVPTLNYTVEPISMSGNISRAVLNLEGQLVPYSHGPTTPKSILWPNALSSSQDISRLSLSRQGDSQALSFQGLWSSFRLFDKTEISQATAESVDVNFQIGNSRIKYRLRMASTQRNPFAIRSLSQLRLPEQL